MLLNAILFNNYLALSLRRLLPGVTQWTIVRQRCNRAFSTRTSSTDHSRSCESKSALSTIKHLKQTTTIRQTAKKQFNKRPCVNRKHVPRCCKAVWFYVRRAILFSTCHSRLHHPHTDEHLLHGEWRKLSLRSVEHLFNSFDYRALQKKSFQQFFAHTTRFDKFYSTSNNCNCQNLKFKTYNKINVAKSHSACWLVNQQGPRPRGLLTTLVATRATHFLRKQNMRCSVARDAQCVGRQHLFQNTTHQFGLGRSLQAKDNHVKMHSTTEYE